jgi:hypothetical protein
MLNVLASGEIRKALKSEVESRYEKLKKRWGRKENSHDICV